MLSSREKWRGRGSRGDSGNISWQSADEGALSLPEGNAYPEWGGQQKLPPQGERTSKKRGNWGASQKKSLVNTKSSLKRSKGVFLGKNHILSLITQRG